MHVRVSICLSFAPKSKTLFTRIHQVYKLYYLAVYEVLTITLSNAAVRRALPGLFSSMFYTLFADT